VISSIYGVSYFKIPISLGAMISFFSLSLSCLNAGARIIYPMGQHLVFPRHLGRAHATNGTPHIAISVYVGIMFLVPTVLEINTNPLTTFGDAGTLAAFGFLLAYFLITFAAPAFLRKRHELRPRDLIVPGLACLCLLVPTIGSFYPVPPYPMRIFPYIFAGYMAAGGVWLFAVSRRRRGILTEIEAGLEETLQAHDRHPSTVSHARDAGIAGQAGPSPVLDLVPDPAE
jgi:amino acid transporter